jgi:thiol-disulfide isomerase/thioredoxin
MEEVILEKPNEMDYFDFIEEAIFNRIKKDILIFDFASESCVACPQQEKILSEIEKKYEYVKVYKLDIGYEDNYEFARGVMKIRKLPSTLILLGDTKKRNQILFGGIIGIEGLEYILKHYGNGRYLCVNCKHRGEQTKGNFYKCEKYGIEVFYKDSCK